MQMMGLFNAILLIVIDFIGLFGNVNFVLLTFMFAQFRKSMCAILMGTVSFCDSVLEIYTIVISVVSLSGGTFLQHTCFYVLSLPIFLNCVQTALMLCIAVDRLVAIALPTFYTNMHTTLFFLLSFIPGFVFGGIVVVTGLLYLEPDETIPVCNVPISMNPLTYNLWNRISLAVNVIMVIIYVLACFLLWRKAREIRTEYITTQITVMNTIICIVAFYVVTWVLPDFLLLFKTSGVLDWDILDYTPSFFAHLCFTGNFYIYIWRNRSYREAFKNMCRCNFNERNVSMVVSRVDSSNLRATTSAY